MLNLDAQMRTYMVCALSPDGKNLLPAEKMVWVHPMRIFKLESKLRQFLLPVAIGQIAFSLDWKVFSYRLVEIISSIFGMDFSTSQILRTFEGQTKDNMGA
jgi:hypothetical protein